MEYNRFKNKSVAILGLAIEGIAVAKFLRDKVSQITILDQRNDHEIIEKAEPDLLHDIEAILTDGSVKKILGDGYLEHLAEFDIIFRTPGISSLHPKIVEARERGVEISSQTKLFFELSPSPTIGVTGTKGKGTTSSLVYRMIKEGSVGGESYLVGNIGEPAATLLPVLAPESNVVFELSSFQLMDLDRSPHIAIVTNLDVEHQDYHHSILEYQQAKMNIVLHQERGDLVILNRRSTFPAAWLSGIKSKISYFSSVEDSTCDAYIRDVAGDIEVILRVAGEEEVICRQSEIMLLGRHNLENIAASAIAASEIGVPLVAIRKVAKEFLGLPHRLELVATIGGVTYVDDSFGTTPGPTMAAISSLKKDKILILGGSSKGADFSELAQKIVSSNVVGVVLIGAEAERIRQSLLKFGYNKELVKGGETIEEVIANANNLAKSGDVVVLSPACASFGMFKNYKDRGEKFKSAVLSLKASKPR
ncbi:MAG: UDP-N-acetylmuramoyl-L-alanine--D-glutamate ligase [Patescibacteria group bacterium]|jgi:UDP-N-acetylmuramoylalanine--D-glutamate ligase